jgi:hypothetical protein
MRKSAPTLFFALLMAAVPVAAEEPDGGGQIPSVEGQALSGAGISQGAADTHSGAGGPDSGASGGDSSGSSGGGMLPPEGREAPGRQRSGKICYLGLGSRQLSFMAGINPAGGNSVDPAPWEKWMGADHTIFPSVRSGQYAAFHVRMPKVSGFYRMISLGTEQGGGPSCASSANSVPQMSFSRTAGDFSAALGDCLGPIHGASTNITAIVTDLPRSGMPRTAGLCFLQPGADYYLNLRYPECPAGESCAHMIMPKDLCTKNWIDVGTCH